MRPRRDVAGVVLLVVVTALWGTTFVVIKDAVASLAPSMLVLARFALAAAVLTLLLPSGRLPLGPGAELGFWLWLGYATQAHGLQFTTASRSAFLTSVSVVLVPVIASLFGRRLHPVLFVSAALAFAGVGLLTFDGAPPNRGDGWTLVTAASYAVYVLRLEAHVGRHRTVPLTVAQLWGVVPFAAAWAAIEALGAAQGSGAQVLEVLRLSRSAPAQLLAAWPAVAYLALVATALTMLLQTEGQRRVAAPEAGVIFALEPVWAAAFAALLLGERLGPAGLVGAMLVIGAVMMAQGLARMRPGSA